MAPRQHSELMIIDGSCSEHVMEGAAVCTAASASLLKRWSRRSAPNPKLSHLSSAYLSTNNLVFFRCPVVMWGNWSEVRDASARKSAMAEVKSKSVIMTHKTYGSDHNSNGFVLYD